MATSICNWASELFDTSLNCDETDYAGTGPALLAKLQGAEPELQPFALSAQALPAGEAASSSLFAPTLQASGNAWWSQVESAVTANPRTAWVAMAGALAVTAYDHLIDGPAPLDAPAKPPRNTLGDENDPAGLAPGYMSSASLDHSSANSAAGTGVNARSDAKSQNCYVNILNENRDNPWGKAIGLPLKLSANNVSNSLIENDLKGGGRYIKFVSTVPGTSISISGFAFKNELNKAVFNVVDTAINNSAELDRKSVPVLANGQRAILFNDDASICVPAVRYTDFSLAASVNTVNEKFGAGATNKFYGQFPKVGAAKTFNQLLSLQTMLEDSGVAIQDFDILLTPEGKPLIDMPAKVIRKGEPGFDALQKSNSQAIDDLRQQLREVH